MDFDPETLTYYLNVAYEEINTLNINGIANDPNATVVGDLGEVSLDRGTNTINIRVIAQDQSSTLYRIVVSRLSQENDILNISVRDFDLDYLFEKDRTIYELEVPYAQSFVIFDNEASDHATLNHNGLYDLEVGVNTVQIYATSQNGQRGTLYEVIITRAEVSDDSSLESLIIKDANTNEVIDFAPEFRPTTTDYIINLPAGSTVDSLIIEGIANNAFATVGGNGYKVLKARVDGEHHNVFEVIVRAEDESTTTYSINVYRDVTLSSTTTINEVTLVGSDGTVYLATGKALNPFTPNTYYYEVIVPYNVNAMSLSIDTETAQAYGTGTKVFINDTLEFKAYIVSQDGTNQTDDYIIKVIREEAEQDNALTDLTVNGETIEGFTSEKTYYEINLPHGTLDMITLDAKTHTTSNITGDLGTKVIHEGRNVYTINVKAQNGDVKTYTIVLNSRSANAFLDDLKIINPITEESYDIVFNPETLEYNVKVGRTESDVLITASAQDMNHAAIIGLGRYTLNDEGGKAIINVIAADHETMLTYTVNLIRDEIPSNNTRLKSLSVDGQQLAFNPNNKIYTLSVGNGIDALSVFAEPEDATASVTIVGHEQLKQGSNVILVEVEAENGDSALYQLLVQRDIESNHFLTAMLIISFLVWIITALIFLIKASLDKKRYKKEMIK